MLRRVAMAPKSWDSRILTFTDVRSYLLTLLMVGLSITVPMVFHQFNLAGPQYLPMQIFILAAGLLFGWRAGVVIGFTSPIISYAISGMPVVNILPQTIIELTTYGFVAGILREKTNLRVIWSLLAAMAAGRLALLLAVTVFSISRSVYSPLGAAENPLAVLWTVVSVGWPGIILQIAAIPFIVKLGDKLTGKV